MKILVVSQYYYPEDFRVNSICEELVKRGHEVTVLTGLPNYPQGNIFSGYEKAYKRPEYHNGVRIIRCKNRPRKKGVINLMANYLSFSNKASGMIKKLGNSYDVVYGYQLSPITSMLPAIKYKKVYHKPLYIYVCDIWPESIREVGGKVLKTSNPVYKYFLKKSKKIYNSADLIGTKCNEFIDYLTNICGVDRSKCHVNLEHAESNYLSVPEKPINNGIVDFMFLGNVGYTSNCESIVMAAKLLKGNSFRIHFVGDGSALDNVKRLVSENDLESKIVFHCRCSQEEVLRFYELADVCLLTLSNTTIAGLTPPAKLAGYMAACRPVVASIDGSSKQIIEKSNCGFVCSAGDINGLSKIMQNIVDNPNIIDDMGNNGRNFYKSFLTLSNHVDRLLQFLNEVG